MRLISISKINIIRISASVCFLLYTGFMGLMVFLGVGFVHFLFAVVWYVLCRKKMISEYSQPFLPYIPQVLDTFLMTLLVTLTGFANSFVVMGYIVIVALSSLNADRDYGISALTLSFMFYTIFGFLIKFEILPMFSIFNPETEFGWFQFILSAVVLVFCLYLVYFIVYSLVLKIPPDEFD